MALLRSKLVDIQRRATGIQCSRQSSSSVIGVGSPNISIRKQTLLSVPSFANQKQLETYKCNHIHYINTALYSGEPTSTEMIRWGRELSNLSYLQSSQQPYPKIGRKHCFSSLSSSQKKQRQRKQGANTDQQQQHKDKVLKASQSFLNSHEKVKSIVKKTREISRLVNQWNNIWGAAVWNSSNTHITSSTSVTLDGVESVDKLVHILFDIIEDTLSQKKEIKSSYQQLADLALSGWSKAPPTKYNGIKAQKLLERMENIYHNRVQPDSIVLQPTTISYGAAICAWSNTIDTDRDHVTYKNSDDSERFNGAKKAELILKRMEKMHRSGENILAKPNLIVYNTCLHGYAQRGMIYEAEALIEKLEELHPYCNDESYDSDTKTQQRDTHTENLCPDVYTYSICMNAYQKFNGRIKGEPVEKRAENLLARMMKKYGESGDRRFMPNQFTFGTVISILARSKSHHGAADADRVLHWLIDLYENESQKNQHSNKSMQESELYQVLQPTVDHFITVLLGYGRSRNKKKACARIEELLVEMERLHEAGLNGVKPTYQCFVIYLDALVKSGGANTEEKANNVLSRMEQIYLDSQDSTFVMNNYAYNLILHSISRSFKGRRSERAEVVIKRMNEIYSKTGNASVLPDKISYTSFIKATIADRRPGFATQCKSIVKTMEEGYSKGNKKLKPDSFVYGNLLNAISIEGYPEDCEKLIDEMEMQAAAGDTEIYPNIVCYNTVMNAYGKRRRGDRAIQAERILRKIYDSRNAGNIKLKVNAASYAICIDALARSNDNDKVPKAEALITELLELYERNQEDSVAPTTNVWCALMLVYAESNLEDKAEKVLIAISRMEKLGYRADNVTYNLLLKACSKTSSDNQQTRQRVLDISKGAFELLQRNKALKPDTFSYNSLLWICDKMIQDPEEKRATIKGLFKKCCNDGEVSITLIKTLKKLTSPALFIELINGDKRSTERIVNMKDLPTEWTRNTRHNKVR